MSKLLLLALALPGAGIYATAILQAESSDPSLLLVLAFILVLVLINGLFVAAEFSIIGVRPSRIEQLANEGHKPAAVILATLNSSRRQDRYIATAQVGITIASLGLGMYSEPQIAHFIEPLLGRFIGTELVHTIGFLLALSFITYLHVVIGEMVPKAIALTRAERTVLWLERPMQVAQLLLSPAVLGLNAIGNGLLRLFGVPLAEGHARLHSPEELGLIVSESAEGGLLNEDEEEMILNIFDFGERQVGQVMTPRRKVQAIPSNLPVDELMHAVAESSNSRFPVYEGDLDHVIGILHLKDLLHHRLRGDGAFDIRLLLRPAPAVPEQLPVETLLAAFKRQRLHMAIVVDEFGGMAGIVTLEDLIEEIVGEVRDEFDVEKEPFTLIEPGTIEVAGNFLLDDLVDHVYLGDEESLPDVETVGGLIVTGLGRPPQQGDELVYDGEVRFIVLDIDGLAVARARVEFPVVDENGNGTRRYTGDDSRSNG